MSAALETILRSGSRLTPGEVWLVGAGPGELAALQDKAGSA